MVVNDDFFDPCPGPQKFSKWTGMIIMTPNTKKYFGRMIALSTWCDRPIREGHLCGWPTTHPRLCGPPVEVVPRYWVVASPLSKYFSETLFVYDEHKIEAS